MYVHDEAFCNILLTCRVVFDPLIVNLVGALRVPIVSTASIFSWYNLSIQEIPNIIEVTCCVLVE